MSKTTNHFKLGVFTLCGLAILIAGILVFGARSYFEPTSLFETYVEGDVTGLAVGSAVELRGVRVGKITRIGFSWSEYQESTPSYVVVEFEMRDDVAPLPPGEARSEMLESAVKRGLRARLKSQGVTGTSILSLEYLNPDENPPAKVLWTPKHTYIPAAPGQLGELLASIEKTLRNLEQLNFSNINELVQGDLKSAGQVLDKLNQLDFRSLGTNANSLLTESRATISQLQPAIANIDFNALNQTLANAQHTVHDLDDVLAEFKNYPSGFLFGSPPPPVKEVQPSPKK